MEEHSSDPAGAVLPSNPAMGGCAAAAVREGRWPPCLCAQHQCNFSFCATYIWLQRPFTFCVSFIWMLCADSTFNVFSSHFVRITFVSYVRSSWPVCLCALWHQQCSASILCKFHNGRLHIYCTSPSYRCPPMTLPPLVLTIFVNSRLYILLHTRYMSYKWYTVLV